MKRRLLSLLAMIAVLAWFFLTTKSIKGTSHLLCVPGAGNIQVATVMMEMMLD